MVEVRDIVTPMMHYDVMFHLASVYIGSSCASVSVVLVSEVELSFLESPQGAAGELMYISIQ